MKLRALVVEDEPMARAALVDLLARRDDVEVVGEADSLATATLAIERLAPELIFLDVTLKDGNGFELVDGAGSGAHIVLVTASADHALRAFDIRALDYVLKPPAREPVDRALERALEAHRKRATAPAGFDRIELREASRVRYCAAKDIVFIRSADNYSEVRLSGGETYQVLRSLSEWVERLPLHFVRCHRSLLVNLDYVEALESRVGGGARLRLRTIAEELPVSRRKAMSFRSRVARHRNA
ncbi:MAG: LytTR family DNA-binding domain-containing protein [Myxococcota bacterium]